MLATKYIEKTREYLDYLEEHILNVQKAFDELVSKGKENDAWWHNDPFIMHNLSKDVLLHDISKFSCKEFVQYRECFYPIDAEEKERSSMDEAWEHHKENNSHHHETISDLTDALHMVIDWMAMSYKFGDTPRAFYESNKKKMDISASIETFLYSVFDVLEK